MPHILVAESLHQHTFETLLKNYNATVYDEPLKAHTEESGYHFHYLPDITVAEIEETLRYYDAVITRPKAITTAAIAPAEHLKMIIRGGAGVNSIDLVTAAKQEVIVENTPGQNSISTAEYTFGFIYELAARRNIFIAHIDVMENSEEELLAMPPEPYRGHELYKQKLAIIGLGAIGQEVAKRAKSFGMEVVAYSASFQKGKKDKRVEELGIEQAGSMEEAIRTADIITLHVPLTSETKGMVNDKWLGTLKQGAIIIDTARPQLIEPSALKKTIAEGRLGGVAIDGDPDLILPFVRIAKEHGETPMLLTHHIADSTEEAQINITKQCLHQLFSFFEEGKIINKVN